MAVIMHRDGKQAVLWEPTTALLCSACREDIKPTRHALQTVNFMFDFDKHPDALAAGEYFYLHKPCTRIEDALCVQWGWHPLGWVLGTDKHLTSLLGNLQKHLRKQMPPGVYDQLYAAWLPAIKPRMHKRAITQPILTPQRVTQPKTPRGLNAGYVYILHAEGTMRVKIGRSASALLRFETLRTASPYPLVILRTIPTSDAVALERMLHQRYSHFRQHREWFDLPHDMLAALLSEDFDV
jgi:hypothetical protein